MDTVLGTSFSKASPESLPDIPGFAVQLRDVLTAEECQQIIQNAEAKGFTQAALYTDFLGSDHMNTDVRKSQRCIVDSHTFAASLWERIQHAVPVTFTRDNMVFTATGINERLRILRYYPGDEFKPHMDGQYGAPNGDISQITILIYLNEGYKGGFTSFMNADNTRMIPVEPHTGMVVLQDQKLLHGVPSLLEGVKYAIRTEVMYRPPAWDRAKIFKDIVVRE